MSLNKECSDLQRDISINENKEKNKDENSKEIFKIIKPRNFLITYYKKIYKKGNEIIEELEKNTFDFYFQNEEEIKIEKEEKINEQNEKKEDEKIEFKEEKKEDEKIEFKEEKKEDDEIIEWDNEEEEENYSKIEEESSDSENEYKSSINFILSKLKAYKKNNEKRNLNVQEKYTLKNFNNEIKKSCLKFRYENKNDSFDTAENSINNEKKNVNFSKFINVFIFKKDDNNKKENGPIFIKTYIKSL